MKKFFALFLLTVCISSTAIADAMHDFPAGDPDEVSCILGFPDNIDAQIILTSRSDSFSILTPSSMNKSIEIVYDKQEIFIFMHPIEVPILECEEGDDLIMVWDNLIMVNGSYFSISNGTAINEN